MENYTELLASSCQIAPSADNSQPCHYTWNGQKFTLRYDTDRVESYTFPADNPATLLSVGSVIENLMQLAEALGLNPNLVYWPAGETQKDVYADVCIDDPDKQISAHPDHPIFHRHTNRFGYNKKLIPSDLLNNLTSMSENTAQLDVFDKQSSIDSIWQLIKSASEIRFQTQEVHEWLGKSLRFTQDHAVKGDGLDVNTLDLPPGGGLFLQLISSWTRMKRLNHLYTYKILASIDAKPIKVAPAIVAITAPDNAQGAIEAGRLLNRCWTHLNDNGIAVHPYYVVADQLIRLKEQTIPTDLIGQAQDIEQHSRDLFSLSDGKALYMLLRIGYPKKQPPHSKRLPLGKVFTDLTKK